MRLDCLHSPLLHELVHADGLRAVVELAAKAVADIDATLLAALPVRLIPAPLLSLSPSHQAGLRALSPSCVSWCMLMGVEL